MVPPQKMAKITLPSPHCPPHLSWSSLSLFNAPEFELLGTAPGKAGPRGVARMLDVTQSCLLNKAKPALIVPGISANPLSNTHYGVNTG